MPETNETKEVKSTKTEVKMVQKKKESKKLIEGLKRFFAETKAEFKKIVWPAPQTVLNNTIVVLVTIFVVGALIWCLDALTSSGLNAILKNY